MSCFSKTLCVYFSSYSSKLRPPLPKKNILYNFMSTYLSGMTPVNTDNNLMTTFLVLIISYFFIKLPLIKILSSFAGSKQWKKCHSRPREAMYSDTFYSCGAETYSAVETQGRNQYYTDKYIRKHKKLTICGLPGEIWNLMVN